MQPTDLLFLEKIVRHGSLSSAARELGVTPASVSKKLLTLEERLGVTLMNRTTRRLSLTREGEICHASALRIIVEMQEMERQVAGHRGSPRGLLRVNAPLGFGRSYVTPIVSRFVKAFPEVEVQLQLTDHPMRLVDEAFDVGIRFGEVPDSRLVARKLAANRRLLCAAPGYLKRHGIPTVPQDLARHNCILLRQDDAAWGTWKFTKGRHAQTVKVGGTLSSNDGEVALKWVLDGHGIMLRSEWDIARYLRAGRLQLLLEDYAAPPADIFAVTPAHGKDSVRIRSFTDFLVESFRGAELAPARKVMAW